MFGSATHLAIKDLDTGAETHPKSAPVASLYQQPDWSPDGRRMLCVALEDGVPRVQVLDLVDDRLESTTDAEASLYNPHWSPDGSRMAFMMTDTGHPPTIQTARPDGTDRRPVTTSGSYPTAKAITYQSKDGLAIPAYLFEPARCAAAKCAAIVWLHGGLGGQFGNAFDRQVQYFVGQGFVVMAPNYRSSGGYGTELSAVDATGQKEMEDVAGAVEYLRRQPAVDHARIGLMGFSFGGLVTLLTVTHEPELVAAAVDMYGPTDLARWYNDAPTSRAVLRIGMGGTPDEKPAAYRAASPVNAADRVRAPILIVHGDADDGVPVSQATIMADALRRAHKEYDLVVIRGGDHGFVTSGLEQAMETAMRFLLAKLQSR